MVCGCLCMRAQGKRYALPNTRIMLHHPSGSARGAALDIHNEARELMRLRGYINGVLSQATGQPIERVRTLGLLVQFPDLALSTLRRSTSTACLCHDARACTSQGICMHD